MFIILIHGLHRSVFCSVKLALYGVCSRSPVGNWPKFDDLLVECRTCESGDRILQSRSQQPQSKPGQNRHRQTTCFYCIETPTVPECACDSCEDVDDAGSQLGRDRCGWTGGSAVLPGRGWAVIGQWVISSWPHYCSHIASTSFCIHFCMESRVLAMFFLCAPWEGVRLVSANHRRV